MTALQDNDKLYRYLFQNRGVRGEWVRVKDTFNDAIKHHQYPQNVQNLLGEMLCATALLTATLKFEGKITMQIQGEGALRLAVVNGDDKQQMRAVARFDENQLTESMDFQQMIGNAVLVITITPNQGERYQGVVALEKPSLSEALEDYFQQSEQLQTQLILKAGKNAQGKKVAAGLLLQVMPDGTGTAEDFTHLSTLAATVKNDECFDLAAKELLYRLFHEEEVLVYPEESVQFVCGCSEERTALAILNLAAEELSELFQEGEGEIKTTCQSCGVNYAFNEESLKKYALDAESEASEK